MVGVEEIIVMRIRCEYRILISASKLTETRDMWSKKVGVRPRPRCLNVHIGSTSKIRVLLLLSPFFLFGIQCSKYLPATSFVCTENVCFRFSSFFYLTIFFVQ